MSTEAIHMEATPRETAGTADCRRLRRQGQLPAVIYKDGQPGRNVQLNLHEFGVMLHKHTSESLMLDLKIGQEAPRRVYLREVQHHPVTGNLLHVDFLEVALDKPLRVPVALELVGDAPGVVNQGGNLEQVLYSVEVDCLPNDVVEQFDIDVSGLELGQALTIGDLPVDRSRYTLHAEEGAVVVSVAAPRVSAASEEEEGEEAASGEGGASASG